MSDPFQNRDPQAQVFAFERRIWILLNLLLFFGAVLAIWSGINQKRTAEVARKAAVAREASLQASIDSLRSEVSASRDLDLQHLGLDGLTRDEFIRRGLTDPATDIRRDLERRRDLLPKPLPGGEPTRLVSSHILNDRWVMAWVEDGHGGQQMLLAYTVNPGGAIDWKVLVTQGR